MNTKKQFWTLVKFLYLMSPLMWFMPFIVGTMTFIPFLVGRDSTYHSNFFFYLQVNQVYFFIGIFGSTLIGPEKFQFNRLKANAGFSGTEFLLTRAVDRPILYRAKSFLVYVLFLLLPICTLIYFLASPELIVNESSKGETARLLANIPGSEAVAAKNAYMQPDIVIPYGKLMISDWQIWLIILTVIVLQLMIMLLFPFKYGKFVFWTLCYSSLLVPSFLPLLQMDRQIKGLPSIMEQAFYLFLGHQFLAWMGLIVAAVLCERFCERSFARQEQ